MKSNARLLLLAAATAIGLAATPARADVVKVAFIDPLSGPFAPVGQNLLKSFQSVADIANRDKWAPGHTFEVVGFDNKASPQESLTVLKTAIDQGFRYIVQGNGSGAAGALIDAINKHNDRNPGKEIVFLNYAAVDPDLTNSKCSFWHFRLDANSDMKMEALTAFLAKDASVKKVYIIGQNYAHGHQVTRAAKDYLKRKRPDVEIVGDDLHPIGSVKDFSPYVAKIAASGADVVITGNWGSDLALLVKAAREASLKAKFYTFYGYTTGVPTVMGAAAADYVRYAGTWNVNNETYSGKDLVEGFKKKFNDDFYAVTTYSALQLLGIGIRQAKSTDPVKVAFAMEGQKFKTLNGEVEMRKADHQLQQPIYITTWVKTNGKDVKFDQENTGYGWRTEQKIEPYVAAQPTSCNMKRPS
ncbi:MAG: branched-chain amino acid ABC transporter substrate-binding protein [Burkholderiaceae bacterium]|nr:branched-chain amino acid ABC transporter substrate-binding protein [Burkholderiaceae bacterium]